MKTTNCYGFKYRSGDSGTFKRDLDSLKNDYFYAPLISSLNDPFEGRFERKAVDNQFDLISKLVENFNPTASESIAEVVSAVDDIFSFVDKCGVFCSKRHPP